MADINSGDPIRTQYPSQVNYNDVIVKLGDATNPATQQAAVDTFGSVQSRIADATGAVVTSQTNGTQRALDVGINVAGVQIDPRAIRALTATDVVTANQGSAAATHASPWWIRLTDGTSDSTLAPASTAAATTQAALVVALSPNSPLPAGTNLLGSVNQGTSPWVTKDAADGPVAPGTAAANSALAGLVYNSAAVTLTTGQQSALQGDVNGYLKVNIAAGSIDVGVADKSTFTYGTSIFQPVGGVFQDTAPTLTAGQSGAQRLTANRGAHVNLRDSNGNEKLAQQTSALSIPVVIASDQSHFPIELQDGAGNAITSQVNGTQRALDVGINVAGIQVDPRAIRALTAADIVTAAQGAAGTASAAWFQKITDGTNVAAVKAASTAAAATDPALVVALSPNSPLPAGSATIGAVNQGLAGTIAQSWFVKVGDGTNFAGVAPASTAAVGTQPSLVVQISPNQAPIPVSISAAEAGTPIEAYNTASAVAAGATSNHQYTVTAGKTLSLQQIEATASGKMKIEVQIETGVGTNVFVSRFVQFNSTNTPNMSLRLAPVILVAAGVRVQIIRTNKDLLAMDLYSTIGGQEN